MLDSPRKGARLRRAIRPRVPSSGARLPSALLTLTLPVASLLAQGTIVRSDSGGYQYPTEIVVTAPRLSTPLKELPFPASIVGADILESLPRSIAIDEPLKLVPGVNVDNQANGSRVHLSIRGQGILTERGIRGIRILEDGIPLNDPTGFAPDFFDVDFASVDHLEVLRGTAASLYGGSASGGVINILTRNSAPEPISGEAIVTSGSNGFWKTSGGLGGNFDPVNAHLTFSRMMGTGYRDHTNFQGDILSGKARVTPSASFSITPLVVWTRVYHENPEGITLQQFVEDPRQANPDAIPFNEFLETERTTGGFTAVLIPGARHELRVSAYVKRTLFTEANNRTFNDRKILTPGASFQYLLKSGNQEMQNTLSIGSDLQWQTIDERRVDNLFSRRGDTLRSLERILQSGAGFFLIEELSLGPHWVVLANLRYDRMWNELLDQLRTPSDLSGSADFAHTTARLGVTYSPSRTITLFGNWGEGFLPPATEELAQNPDHFGGLNRHLVPATSWGVDLGVRGGVGEVWYGEVSLFSLSTRNDFDRYRISDPLRTQETFYRNAGSSQRYGMEVFGRSSPVPALTAQVAYTFSHFRYTNASPLQVLMDDPGVVKWIVSGNWLPNSPRHQLFVDCQLRLLRQITLGVSAEAQSETYIDGANLESEAAPSYLLLHARVAWAWSALSLRGECSLQGRNLTGRNYVAFTEPDPGGNSYQSGPGREFFAQLRILP